MEKYIDELKKKVLELCDTIDKQNDLIKKYQKALEMSATIAEQEDEIALNERVLNIVLEDHFCHSPNETVQSFICGNISVFLSVVRKLKG